MRVRFLAHNESIDHFPRTFIAKDDADFLLGSMTAERISSKVIRAFPPDSAFRRMPGAAVKHAATKLSIVGELPGLRFRLRPSQAGRYVSEMHHLALRSFRHQLSA